MQRIALNQGLKTSVAISTGRATSARSNLSRQFTAAYSESLPSVTQKDFWRRLIPKPFRKSSVSDALKKPRSKEWNPATFYIWMFLLIGSMPIQMIATKNEHATFTRKADTKIALLKDVIERVQRGEQVDVAGLLGKGNKQQEDEWAEVMEEIASQARFTQPSKPRSARKKDDKMEEDSPNKQDIPTKLDDMPNKEPDTSDKPKPRTNAPRGFY